MAEVGSAYVTIFPKLAGGGSAIAAQLNGSGIGAALGQDIGSALEKSSGLKNAVSAVAGTVGDAFKLAANVAIGTVTGIGVALAGLAVGGGISRAMALDEANAKFRALFANVEGGGAKAAAVMDAVKSAVDGTRFSLDSVANASIGFVAVGYEGAALERVLRNVQDAAGLTGKSVEQLALPFQEAARSGRVMGDTLRQLEENGVPATKALSDALGVSLDDIRKMASDGKISFTDLQDAMEASFGGMASNADSFSAAWAMFRANLSKTGAEFAAPVLEALKGILQAFVPVIKDINTSIAPFAEQFAGKLAPAAASVAEKISGLSDRFSSLSGSFSIASGAIAPLVGVLAGFGSQVIGPLLSALPGLSGIGGIFSGMTGPIGLVIGLFVSMFQQSEVLRTAFGQVFSALGTAMKSLAPAFELVAGLVAQLAGMLGDALGNAIIALMPAVTTLIENLGPILTMVLEALIPIIVQLVDMVGPILTQVITALVPIVQQLANALGPILTQVIQALMPTIEALLPVIQSILDTVMRVFNALMPVIEPVLGAIIAIIQTVLALITGDWEGAWQGIKDFFSSIWDAIKAIPGAVLDAVKAVISGALDVIKGVWGAAWDTVSSKLSDVWNGIKNAVTTAISDVKASIDGIKDKVTGAFANAAQWLVDAGKKIINGLWEGMKKAWETVTGWLSDLGGAIVGLKGPPSYDATLLTGNGRLIIQSLLDGFTQEEAAVEKWFGGFTDRLGASVSGTVSADVAGSAVSSSASDMAAAFGGETSSPDVVDAIERLIDTIRGDRLTGRQKVGAVA
jgi:tape measure domain-containing protein